MKISIIGTGYVGLVSATALASKGHKVTCVDIDEDKVKKINQGTSPIHEEGLEELLSKAIQEKKLKATTNTTEAIKDSELVFITVGTPSKENGRVDLSYVEKATRDIGKALKEKKEYCVVTCKSTVPPTTTQEKLIPILEEESGRKAGEEFGVCMNPEFLREGIALKDFLNPDRIVIGELDEKSGNILEKTYREFDSPILRTSIKAAEMVKYASNSLLATKISFINEIGNMCKELGIDVYEVADTVGKDHRINRDFLNAGCGFGGSCFPKDLRAFISEAKKEWKQEPKLLESVIEVNLDQKTKLVGLLEEKINLEGTKVSVLGLAFKPGTDDIRNSPAIPIIKKLKSKGAEVVAYDPEAMENMKKIHPDIEYADSPKKAVQDTDACLIVTDWPEFQEVNTPKLTLEGRRMNKGEGICW